MTMTQPITASGGGDYGQGLSQFFGGPTIQAPNADASNTLLQQAADAQQMYQGQGQGYTQQGATINNPQQAAELAQAAQAQGNLGNIGALLSQTAQGQGPAAQAAQAQMAAATGQNIAAQTAMARSATGGALAQNAAQLGAQGNIASSLGQAAANSEGTMANMENQAAQAAGNVYGQQGQLAGNQLSTMSNQAQQQAQLQQANQAQINAQQIAYGQLGVNEGQLALNTLSGYNADVRGSEGLAAGGSQAGLQDMYQGIGAVGGAVSGGANTLSDERCKTNIHDEGMEPHGRASLADDFLSQLHPASYEYKEDQDSPSGMGGKHLGVMAQDLLRTPEVGSRLVVNTPRGLAVEPKATLSAALAGIGRLTERVKELEKSHG